MINFSKIPNNSFIGIILRFFLKIIPENTTVRILQGRLKGRRWTKGSGVNGYWLGSYEPEQAEIFEREIKNGDIVFDIGANVGFYSLLAAEIVGPSGKVYAFEPLPENFNYLKKHIEINGYKNIFPFKAAVSDRSGFAFFGGVINRAEGRLVEKGELEVAAITIDDWIKNKKLSTPDFIKIDVEGAEFQVLKGAENVLKEKKPAIFLSTHSKEIHKKCCEFLKSLGYSLSVIKGDSVENASEILAEA